MSPRVIREPDDWARLPVLDPGKGALAAQLESLRLLVEDLGPDIPIIQTIFNPLAQAKNLAGQETLLVHLRQYPDAVKAGLQIITESIQKFIAAAQETGIAGLFYAVQHAQRHLLTDQEYLEFGRAYDLPILGVAEKMWLNMLHLHGKNVMFDLFLEYPVGVINWHDLETPPSLAEAHENLPRRSVRGSSPLGDDGSWDTGPGACRGAGSHSGDGREPVSSWGRAA